MLTCETELENWLINAFNGEWLKVANPKSIDATKKKRSIAALPQAPSM